MQKGLATLEIIFVMIIIAVLMSVTLPNVRRIIDTAALDYETKRLYSELRFVEAMNRSSKINTIGTGGTGLLTDGGEKPTLFIDYEGKYYQVFRDEGLTKKIREPNYFSYGIKISSPKNKINFDSDGKANINSDHITLTSRFGKKKYIVFNSVGRMRASLTEADE